VNNRQFRAAGRIAGKTAGKFAHTTGERWIPAVRNPGKFVRHVVPAAVKPLHALWHEVLGFLFLVFAGWGAFEMWKEGGKISPVKFGMIGIFVLVMAAYGLSSVLKARRISRS